MSAERLREAARVLRERAEATTWVPECGGWWLPFAEIEGYEPGHYPVAEADSTVAEATTGGTATYIATMHPGVGLALAHWLDDLASRAARGFALDDDPDMQEAVTVADLILGGAR